MFGLGRPRGTFRHGVHPPENKRATDSKPIERMPFVAEYVLPLSQHIGAPARPVVSVGQRVGRGQPIAAPAGFVSTALHAPVTGTVAAIELRTVASGKEAPAIVIKTDPFSSQVVEVDAPARPEPSLSASEVIRAIQHAGIVGMGGAAFPSHVKLQVPAGKKARFAMLNGCECEPYLTCDHRVMVERPDAIVAGLRILLRRTGAERGYIGIERNKPDAIAVLQRACAGEPDLEVVPLAVKYPQGAEKMLIDAVLQIEVPSGKLPIDVEVATLNVGTAAAIADLFSTGQPLIERVVTVTGDAIGRPANVLVPIGTPLRDLLAFCGGVQPHARQVVLGGPMMGTACKSLDISVTKGTSGILALSRAVEPVAEEPCIKCGRCLDACPYFLNPSLLGLLSRNDLVDDLAQAHVLDCCECASCSFVCPSHIPLVQLIRIGKATVRQHQAALAAKALAAKAAT